MTVLISNWTESDGRNPVVLFNNLLVDATPLNSVAIAGSGILEEENTYDSLRFFESNTNIDYQLPEASEVNAVGFVGEKLSGGVVSVWTSTNGSSWTQRASATIQQDGTSILIFNLQSSEYYRVRFAGLGSFFGPEEERGLLRNLFVGKLFEFPGGVGYGYTPVWMAKKKELLVSETMGGQFVGNRVMSVGAETTIPMIPEDRIFVEEDMQPFIEHYNDGRPFFWAAGPSVFTKDVSYVWRQDGAEINPVFDQSGNWMSFDMSVSGYVN